MIGQRIWYSFSGPQSFSNILSVRMVFLEGVLKVYCAIGFDPFPKSTKFTWYDLRKWLLLICVFYSVIPQVTFTVVYFNEILKSAKSLSSLMVTVSTLGKICVKIVYQNQMRVLLEEIDAFIGQRQSESTDIFGKVEKRTHKMFRIYNLFCWTTTVIYGVSPALAQTYLFVTGKATDETFVMPFDTEYFFDSSKAGVYQICYFNGFVSLLSTVHCAVSLDSLFLGFCIYIGEMYGTLDINLREMRSFYEHGECDDEQAAKFKESLKILLNDHNQILTIIGHLNEIYGPIVLIQFLSSQFMIANLIFQSLYVSDADFFLFLSYLCVTLYQLFIYCYGGAVLSYACEKFATNVYDLNWYNYPIWAQKCILLILGVSQKTQKVGGTLFQACDLSTFCQILKVVYLIFTVLNSLK